VGQGDPRKESHLPAKGIEVEEIGPGEQLTVRTLTAERIERLGSLGFVWAAAARGCEKISWEGRFQELLEYVS